MQIELEVSIMSLLFLLHLVQYQAETSNVLGIFHHKFEKKAIQYIVYISTFHVYIRLVMLLEHHNKRQYRHYII